MSSPLMPVMSGTEVPAARVVVSFDLKSPPMEATVSFTSLLKCVFASATTLSLSAPPQYHKVRFLPFLPPAESEPLPHATVRPEAAAVNAAAWRKRLRERSTGSLLLLLFDVERGAGISAAVRRRVGRRTCEGPAG